MAKTEYNWNTETPTNPDVYVTRRNSSKYHTVRYWSGTSWFEINHTSSRGGIPFEWPKGARIPKPNNQDYYCNQDIEFALRTIHTNQGIIQWGEPYKVYDKKEVLAYLVNIGFLTPDWETVYQDAMRTAEEDKKKASLLIKKLKKISGVPKVSMIYARSENNVIGNAGSIPWFISEDVKRFKTLTMNSCVIMGRKTWDSLPKEFKPLPGRLNIVVTRNKDWAENGAVRVASLEAAVTHPLVLNTGRVWVIGGSSLLKEAEAIADSAEVTVVHSMFKGDTFAPHLHTGKWEQSTDLQAPAEALSKGSNLRYSFLTYKPKLGSKPS